MQEQNKTAAQMIEALRDDMYEKYGMGWDGFEFGQIQILMEQYAAQQVQGLKYQYVQVISEHVDQKMKSEPERDNWQDAALRKGEELAEVTRQRDEAASLLDEIEFADDCPFYPGSFEARVKQLLSQLENKQKDDKL